MLTESHAIEQTSRAPHYVFDLWANRWRHHPARGQVIIVRYADDIVVGFEHKAQAEQFLADTAAADGKVRVDAA